MTPPLTIGELSYLNTVPFRLPSRWHSRPCPSPRTLALWAEDGRIDAGPIPVVEGRRLDGTFAPLPFGIAAADRAVSVILLSRKPWAELDQATIGLTDQSSTSVRLLKLLFETRDGLHPRFREGFSEEDDARLLIGDAALSPDPKQTDPFPCRTDLGREWRRWQGLPFVFARWRVRRTATAFWKQQLIDALNTALEDFDRNGLNRARPTAQSIGLTPAQLTDYFSALTYRLGPDEIAGEEQFHRLWQDSERRVGC